MTGPTPAPPGAPGGTGGPRRPPGAAERLALAVLLLVVAGIPAGLFGARWFETRLRPGRIVELTARIPAAGQPGWTPDTVVVAAGERVRLRVRSVDVVHGLAIPKLGVEAAWVEPGKVTEIDLVATRPGRYAFLCTVWCELGHWRMRGTIEVVDPTNPQASALDPDPPRTDWMAAGLDLDADHRAAIVPAGRPDARRGARLWQTLDLPPAAELRATLDLRRRSPAEVYATLAAPGRPAAAAVARLDPAERWDLVAHVWRSGASPQALALDARLYRRDCTGCHGPEGRGDGPGAAAIRAGAAGHVHDRMRRPPVDFTDLAAQAGAPDLLYYGKLVRGGMGTSMPYWSPVYREAELWALVAVLRSFAFGPPAGAGPAEAAAPARPRDGHATTHAPRRASPERGRAQG